MTQFYEYSLKRDVAFLKNLTFNSRAPLRVPYSVDNSKVTVIITGGFHTENLADLFKKNKIPYVSIMPNFKTEDGYECPYFRILSGIKYIRLKTAVPMMANSAIHIPDQLSPALDTALQAEVMKLPLVAQDKPEASQLTTREEDKDKTTALIPTGMNSIISALQSGSNTVEFSIDAIRRFIDVILSPHFVGFKDNPYFIPPEDYETVKLLHGFLLSCRPVLYGKFLRRVHELGFLKDELSLARPDTWEVGKGLRSGFSVLGHSLTPDSMLAAGAFYPGVPRKERRFQFEWIARPWLLLAGADENQVKAIFDSWERRDGAITREPWFDDIIRTAEEGIHRALPKGKSLSPVANFLFKWTRLDANVPTQARILFGHMAIRSIEDLRGQEPAKALTYQRRRVKELQESRQQISDQTEQKPAKIPDSTIFDEVIGEVLRDIAKGSAAAQDDKDKAPPGPVMPGSIFGAKWWASLVLSPIVEEAARSARFGSGNWTAFFITSFILIALHFNPWNISQYKKMYRKAHNGEKPTIGNVINGIIIAPVMTMVMMGTIAYFYPDIRGLDLFAVFTPMHTLFNIYIEVRNLILPRYAVIPASLVPDEAANEDAEALSVGSWAYDQHKGRIEVYKDGKHIKTYLKNIQPAEFAGLDNVTIRTLLGNNGQLMAGRTQQSWAMFRNYGRRLAEARVEQGFVTSVKLYKANPSEGAERTEIFRRLIDTRTRRIVYTFWGSVSKKPFLRLFEAHPDLTLTHYELGSYGSMRIGGGFQKAQFRNYPNRLIEADFKEGYIYEMRIFKEGRMPKDDGSAASEDDIELHVPFAWLVDPATGKTIYSFWDVIRPPQLAALVNEHPKMLLKRYKLPDSGTFFIGGYVADYTGLGGRLVAADIDQGFVTRIRVFKKNPNDGLERDDIMKQLCDAQSGAIVRTFKDILLPAALEKLVAQHPGMVLKKYRLVGDKGTITFGKNEQQASFTDFAGRIVEADVEEGFITKVRILKEGSEDEVEKEIIFNRFIEGGTNKIVYAYYRNIYSARLSALLKKHKKLTLQKYTLSPYGVLSLASGALQAVFRHFPNYEVEVEIEDGEISVVYFISEENGVIKKNRVLPELGFVRRKLFRKEKQFSDALAEALRHYSKHAELCDIAANQLARLYGKSLERLVEYGLLTGKTKEAIVNLDISAVEIEPLARGLDDFVQGYINLGFTPPMIRRLLGTQILPPAYIERLQRTYNLGRSRYLIIRTLMTTDPEAYVRRRKDLLAKRGALDTERYLTFYDPDRSKTLNGREREILARRLRAYSEILSLLSQSAPKEVEYTGAQDFPGGCHVTLKNRPPDLKIGTILCAKDSPCVLRVTKMSGNKITVTEESGSEAIMPASGALIHTPQDVTYRVQKGVVDEIVLNLERSGLETTGFAAIDRILRLAKDLSRTDPNANRSIRFYDKNIKRREATAKSGEKFTAGDESQETAVRLALGDARTEVVHGPPGTGKTTVIAEMIRHYVKQGRKVLLVSQMNQAVDNALQMVMADVPALRLGNSDEPLKRYGTDKVWIHNDSALQAFEAKRKRMRTEGFLFAGTDISVATDSAGLNRVGRKQFDVVIMDEASRETLTGALVPLQYLKDEGKLVLVGDTRQLPPFKTNEIDQYLKDANIPEPYLCPFSESVLSKIEGEGMADEVLLSTNWRSHPLIAGLSSRIFYDGAIQRRCWEDFTPDTLNLKIIDVKTKANVYYEEPVGTSYQNTRSANEVMKLLEFYTQEKKIAPEDITIVAAYRAQEELLARLVKARYSKGRPRITTIDSYQGGENEAIIIDFVRSNPRRRIGFIDLNRLNVALSRAKENMAIVWDSRVCMEEPDLITPEEKPVRQALREIRDYYRDEVWQFYPEDLPPVADEETKGTEPQSASRRPYIGVWGAPLTGGTYYRIFEYLCNNEILDGPGSVSIEQIAHDVGLEQRGEPLSWETVYGVVIGLQNSLHLIECAGSAGKKGRYYVRREAWQKAHTILSILARFRGDAIRPKVEELRHIFDEEIRPIVGLPAGELHTMTPKGGWLNFISYPIHELSHLAAYMMVHPIKGAKYLAADWGTIRANIREGKFALPRGETETGWRGAFIANAGIRGPLIINIISLYFTAILTTFFTVPAIMDIFSGNPDASYLSAILPLAASILTAVISTATGLDNFYSLIYSNRENSDISMAKKARRGEPISEMRAERPNDDKKKPLPEDIDVTQFFTESERVQAKLQERFDAFMKIVDNAPVIIDAVTIRRGLRNIINQAQKQLRPSDDPAIERVFDMLRLIYRDPATERVDLPAADRHSRKVVARVVGIKWDEGIFAIPTAEGAEKSKFFIYLTHSAIGPERYIVLNVCIPGQMLTRAGNRLSGKLFRELSEEIIAQISDDSDSLCASLDSPSLRWDRIEAKLSAKPPVPTRAQPKAELTVSRPPVPSAEKPLPAVEDPFPAMLRKIKMKLITLRNNLIKAQNEYQLRGIASAYFKTFDDLRTLVPERDEFKDMPDKVRLGHEKQYEEALLVYHRLFEFPALSEYAKLLQETIIAFNKCAKEAIGEKKASKDDVERYIFETSDVFRKKFNEYGRQLHELAKQLIAKLGGGGGSAGTSAPSPKGSPAECLETIKENRDLLIKAMNKFKGVKLQELIDNRFKDTGEEAGEERKRWSQSTVVREVRLLVELGILVPVKTAVRPVGYYRFSDVMVNSSHDPEFTIALVNAINEIKYTRKVQGDNRPLHWGNIPDAAEKAIVGGLIRKVAERTAKDLRQRKPLPAPNAEAPDQPLSPGSSQTVKVTTVAKSKDEVEAISYTAKQDDIDGDRHATLNITTDILSSIHPDDLATIRSCIASVGPNNLNNRSIAIRLAHPIMAIGGLPINPIRMIAVKGSAIDPRKKPLPHLGSGTIPTIKIPDALGRIHSIDSISAPEGGMFLSSAINEYLIHHDLWHDKSFSGTGLQFRYPIGWGQFKDITYNQEGLGFVILGMPELERPNDYGFDLKDEIKERGRILRAMHVRGYCGFNLHGGNCDIYPGDASGLWDFENATSIRRDPCTEAAYTAQLLYDFTYAVDKCLEEPVSRGWFLDPEYAKAFFNSYFGTVVAWRIQNSVGDGSILNIVGMFHEILKSGVSYPAQRVPHVMSVFADIAKESGIAFLPPPASGISIAIPRGDVSYIPLSDVIKALTAFRDIVHKSFNFRTAPSFYKLGRYVRPLVSGKGRLITALSLLSDRNVASDFRFTVESREDFRRSCIETAEALKKLSLSPEERAVISLLLQAHGNARRVRGSKEIVTETFDNLMPGAAAAENAAKESKAPPTGKASAKGGLEDHTNGTNGPGPHYYMEPQPGPGPDEAPGTRGEEKRRAIPRIPSNRQIVQHYKGFDESGVRITPEGRGELISIASRNPDVQDALISAISGIGRHLDILSMGSGQGDIEEVLQEEGHNVLGVDISPKNAKIAMESGVKTIVADAATFKPEDPKRKFNVVLFSESIGHMDKENVLKNAYDNLDEKGHVIVTSYEEAPEDTPNTERLTKYIQYSEAEIEKALIGAGFGIDPHRARIICGRGISGKPVTWFMIIATKADTRPPSVVAAKKDRAEITEKHRLKIHPKDSSARRNRDIIYFLTTPFLGKYTGLDLKQGEHRIVDFGVGMPFTTCQLAAAFRGINPGVEVIGTENPDDAAIAHILCPESILDEYRDEITLFMNVDFSVQLEPENIRSLILAVGPTNDVVEAIVGIGVEKNIRLYKTIAAAGNVTYIAEGETISLEEKRSLFLETLLDAVGRKTIRQLIERGIDNNEIDGTRIVFKPVEKKIEKAGGRFIVTDNPSQNPRTKGASVVTACNVLTHMNRIQKQIFIDVVMNDTLREGGILIIKDAIKRPEESAETDFRIEFYKKCGMKMDYLGSVLSNIRGAVSPESGVFISQGAAGQSSVKAENRDSAQLSKEASRAGPEKRPTSPTSLGTSQAAPAQIKPEGPADITISQSGEDYTTSPELVQEPSPEVTPEATIDFLTELEQRLELRVKQQHEDIDLIKEFGGESQLRRHFNNMRQIVEEVKEFTEGPYGRGALTLMNHYVERVVTCLFCAEENLIKAVLDRHNYVNDLEHIEDFLVVARVYLDLKNRKTRDSARLSEEVSPAGPRPDISGEAPQAQLAGEAGAAAEGARVAQKGPSPTTSSAISHKKTVHLPPQARRYGREMQKVLRESYTKEFDDEERQLINAFIDVPGFNRLFMTHYKNVKGGGANWGNFFFTLRAALDLRQKGFSIKEFEMKTIFTKTDELKDKPVEVKPDMAVQKDGKRYLVEVTRTQKMKAAISGFFEPIKHSGRKSRMAKSERLKFTVRKLTDQSGKRIYEGSILVFSSQTVSSKIYPEGVLTFPAGALKKKSEGLLRILNLGPDHSRWKAKTEPLPITLPPPAPAEPKPAKGPEGMGGTGTNSLSPKNIVMAHPPAKFLRDEAVGPDAAIHEAQDFGLPRSFSARFHIPSSSPGEPEPGPGGRSSSGYLNKLISDAEDALNNGNYLEMTHEEKQALEKYREAAALAKEALGWFDKIDHAGSMEKELINIELDKRDEKLGVHQISRKVYERPRAWNIYTAVLSARRKLESAISNDITANMPRRRATQMVSGSISFKNFNPAPYVYPDGKWLQVLDEDGIMHVTVDFGYPVRQEDAKLVMHWGDPGKEDPWKDIEGTRLGHDGQRYHFEFSVPQDAKAYTLKASGDAGSTWKWLGEYGFHVILQRPDSLAEELRKNSKGKKEDMPVHIRWMIRRDMPEVLEIEEGSYEFPWLEDDFIRCLRQRNCIGMVAEGDGDRILGFMIYEIHKTRIHVLDFTVHPDYRRRGVGRAMVKKLIGKLSLQRRSRLVLEVRESNLGAQAFFREMGFRAVSVLRGFYDDTPEDAYLMQYRYRPDGSPAAFFDIIYNYLKGQGTTVKELRRMLGLAESTAERDIDRLISAGLVAKEGEGENAVLRPTLKGIDEKTLDDVYAAVISAGTRPRASELQDAVREVIGSLGGRVTIKEGHGKTKRLVIDMPSLNMDSAKLAEGLSAAELKPAVLGEAPQAQPEGEAGPTSPIPREGSTGLRRAGAAAENGLPVSRLTSLPVNETAISVKPDNRQTGKQANNVAVSLLAEPSGEAGGLEALIVQRPELQPAWANVSKRLGDTDDARGLFLYMARIYDSFKNVLSQTRQPEEPRYVFMPLPRSLREIISEADQVAVYGSAKRSMKKAREIVDDILKVNGFTNVSVIFYDGTIDGLKKAIDATSAKKGTVNPQNGLAFVDVKEAKVLSWDERERIGVTFIKENIPEKGGRVSIGGHVVLALSVLDLINNDRTKESEYWRSILDIVRKLSNNEEKYKNITKEEFIKLVYREELVIDLPPIEKEPIDKDMNIVSITEREVGSAL